MFRADLRVSNFKNKNKINLNKKKGNKKESM